MFTALKLPKLFWPISLVAFCFLFLSSVGIGYMAAPQAPDRTSQHRNQTNLSADDQMMNSADREITQRIRKLIRHDKSLSAYAQNIRIITRNGEVTLRGPVKSDEERVNLEAKAIDIAGDGNVTNGLNVAPSK
jgi:hyperosmotically inducible periplasmic protein